MPSIWAFLDFLQLSSWKMMRGIQATAVPPHNLYLHSRKSSWQASQEKVGKASYAFCTNFISISSSSGKLSFGSVGHGSLGLDWTVTKRKTNADSSFTPFFSFFAAAKFCHSVGWGGGGGGGGMIFCIARTPAVC